MTTKTGKIESICDRTTKKTGKPYKSYLIDENYYKDFGKVDYDFDEGQNVKFSFEEKGDFRNILHMEALTPMGATHTGGESLAPSFLSPAFFEMCANQATQLLIAKNTEWTDENYKDLVRRLCRLNKELEAKSSLPEKKEGG